MNYKIYSDWTALSTLTGISVGLPMVLSNAGRAGDIIEVLVTDNQPLESDRGVPIKQLDNQYTISGQSSESWVRHIKYDLNGTIKAVSGCLLSVQDDSFINESSALPIDLMTSNSIGSRSLKVSGQPLELLVSKGGIDGHRMIYINAYANDIGITTKLIWPLDSQYEFGDTATSFWLSSTDDTDINTILIQALDSDYNEQNFVVSLNGHTPVEFANNSGLRVNKVRNITATATGGDVYVAREDNHTNGMPDDDSMIVSMFEQEKQTSNLALFTVPAGHTLFGDVGYFSAPKNRDNDMYWNARNPDAGIPDTTTNVVSVYQNTIQIDFAMTPIPEKTDAYFTSSTEQSSGRVSCRVVGILVDNNYL